MRLAPLDPPWDAAVAEDLQKLMPPGMEPLALFRTVAHNPRVLRRFRRSGLLDPGSITVAEREIMIHRTCARCGSEYEWGVHATVFGRANGLDDARLAATVHGTPDDPVWTPREALIVRLADALHDTAAVSEPLWGRLRAEFSPAQLVELVALAGYYHLVSYVTNAFAIPLEPLGERFPPP
ncbi:MAG TPA: carboxymuconolactone decarboxylase family protein [Candidatus Binatia bacterium]|jgi:alkylhydroperoxidase family enzyme|nr:carboxymuconolactone decarboxylase family protein [Candidatus Binatia bacterium]